MKKHCERKSSSRRPAPKRKGIGTLVRRDTRQLQLSPPKPDRAQILKRAHPAIVGGVPYALLTESTTAKNDELCALSPAAVMTFLEGGATVSIAQVGQANLGHGQMVQNFLKQEVPQKNKSVEQTRIVSSGDTAEAKALRTVDERPAVTAGQHPANSALDEKHGPENRRGKGTSRRKRTKARRKMRRYYCSAKTNDGDD